ncbi:MAG TPA: DUF4349 domain-containing protein [Sandaracinaceae bacterium LLY-WYZ-13_1]|nr:DUF4349 domain-containing protein [Sandaracinaceae bacterium LLY-WYZ-13_1]
MDRAHVARRAALLLTAVAAALTGCGGSPAWAEATSPARSVTSRARAQLRARVSADDSATTGARSAPVTGADEVAEAAPVAEGSSGGGFDLSIDLGGGPPPPSPWDAASGGDTAASEAAAARRQLASEVQGGASPAEPARRPRYAQNDVGARGEPTATDATSRPLLIYEAHLGLAVHHVAQIQDRVEEMARERGGFLHSRSDDTIVVRVPADAFHPFLETIQEVGDLVSRRVQVQDVTEEFHDVQQRIRTLEAMRARVEQLLEEADDVEDALAVQQHLERITVELEGLQGRLRFLSDRVAYSTVTVHFAERSTTSAPTFQLPFRWLHSLGLDALLSL